MVLTSNPSVRPSFMGGFQLQIALYSSVKSQFRRLVIFLMLKIMCGKLYLLGKFSLIKIQKRFSPWISLIIMNQISWYGLTISLDNSPQNLRMLIWFKKAAIFKGHLSKFQSRSSRFYGIFQYYRNGNSLSVAFCLIGFMTIVIITWKPPNIFSNLVNFHNQLGKFFLFHFKHNKVIQCLAQIGLSNISCFSIARMVCNVSK